MGNNKKETPLSASDKRGSVKGSLEKIKNLEIPSLDFKYYLRYRSNCKILPKSDAKGSVVLYHKQQ